MPRYAAFLRGINVGGHKAVKMVDLRERLARMGLRNVATLKASGNVIFDSSIAARKTLAGSIEDELARMVGGEVRVFLRTRSEVAKIHAADPFRELRLGDAKPYVTFLADPANLTLPFPRRSQAGEVEIVKWDTTEVYSLGRRVDGRPGFPNGFVEALTKQPATTRNWSTVAETAVAIVGAEDRASG